MKRSRVLRLALMGSAPFVLSACSDEPEQALVYNNVQECEAQALLTPEQCKTEFEKAVNNHLQAAPRYAQQAACEADFGNGACQNLNSGGNWFIPAMAGFMIGQALDRDRHYSGSSFYYGGGGRSQPLYRSRDDWHSWRTANNARIGKYSGKVWVDPNDTKPAMSPRTMSRGGFGSRAAARSSWGG